MSDLTKCHGKNCPIRTDCWRYLAPDDKLMQSYDDFSGGAQPTRPEARTRQCAYWMAVRGKGWKR